MLLNFSRKNIHKKIKNIKGYDVLITNDDNNQIDQEGMALRSYEGVILKK